MKRACLVLAAALVAAFLVSTTPGDVALTGCCQTSFGAMYYPRAEYGTENHGCRTGDMWTSTACPAWVPTPTPTPTATPTPTPTPTATPTPTPTPTPIPEEGEILWRPTNGPSPATYVQSPWAVRDYDGTVYLGGHAGHCCPGLENPAGWEGPWVIQYTNEAVTAQYPVIPFVNWAFQADGVPDATDTHEFGSGTMVRITGPLQAEGWLYGSLRTTKKSWQTMLDTGVGNRARGNLSFTPDPMADPYPLTFWDAVPPMRIECAPRNTPGCGDKNVAGVMMPALVWIDDVVIGGVHYGERLVLYVQDPDGTAAWIVRSGDKWATVMEWFRNWPAIAWGDVAWGDDGRLYALVSARDGSRPGEEACWWWGCRGIDEYVSDDYGERWTRSERSWRTLAGDLVNDACYVRDPRGHIKRDALTVVALIQDSDDPTGPGNWRLHWWADEGAELPRSWGFEPGQFHPPRRHLPREPRLEIERP
jgi:hypothetical protein